MMLSVALDTANIRMEEVLEGSPMTLPYFENFRKYLTKFEHSSENMEFYLWFSNYEKRYYTVKKCGPNGFVPLVPPPTVNLLSLDSPITDSYDIFLEVPHHILKLTANENRWSKGLFNFKKKPKLEFICSNELPFNEEITLVVQLFLNPASSLELNLPSKIKEACLLDLNDSTHPDVFRPIFDHVAQLLSASWINFMRKIRGGKS